MNVPHDLHTLQHRIAAIIGEDPSQLGLDESLLDQGLDSIRVMALLAEWRAAGLAFDAAGFFERPTLRDWDALLAGARARAAR